jgi:hypothetical protein
LGAEKPKDLNSIAKIGALGLYSLTPLFAHSSVFHCGKFYCRRKPKYARKPHFGSQLTDTFIPYGCIIIPSTCDISNSRPLIISNKCKSTTPLLPIFHKTIYVCIVSFTVGGNRSMQENHTSVHNWLTHLSHMVVSSTLRRQI